LKAHLTAQRGIKKTREQGLENYQEKQKVSSLNFIKYITETDPFKHSQWSHLISSVANFSNLHTTTATGQFFLLATSFLNYSFNHQVCICMVNAGRAHL
jgi:hypothetical protein